MESLFRTIALRSSSPTFRRSFAVILLAEAITIFAGWFLLDSNVSRWTHEKAMQAVRISQGVASSEDWSLIGMVPRKRSSALFEKYRGELTKLSKQYFPQGEGSVYLVLVDRGEDYVITPNDQYPMDDDGPASKWELAAYATGKTTYNVVPYSDNDGTYLAANTPIFRNSKIVGLLSAEYDSATYDEFQAIVRKAFLLSILPAIFIALLVAYAIAAMLVEPMEIFRRIEATARRGTTGQTGTESSDPLDRLSPREKEVAEFVRQGLTNKEIADNLVVTAETVKQHLKNIREKTGFNKLDLAVQVEARRVHAAAPTATA
jgi:DNA-binding NarL/FixJ family response regulator